MMQRTQEPKKHFRIATVLYDLAFLTFAVVYAPIFLMKLRQAEEPQRLLRERCGRPDAMMMEYLASKKTIWIHAVSVGEVMAAKKFIELLTQRCPQVHIFLTTVTPTGQRVAKDLESERVSVAYTPFDLSFSVRSYLKQLAPQCLLLMETEIWPNLLTEAAQLKIPVGIVNARLSPKSLKRYRAFKTLFRPVFNKLEFVLSQTEEDAVRFCQLGIEPARVQTLGNMKFDNVSVGDQGAASTSLKEQFEIHPHERILLAGSTHPGEEEILADVFTSLRHHQQFHLKLVIAPRHIERSGALQNKLEAKGLRIQLSSHFKKNNPYDVLIIDELGILKNLYAVADVVFVGGSLVPKGGQNPIEPAALKRVIVHGPHTYNFKKVYRMLDEAKGAQLVQDPLKLSLAVQSFLKNGEEAEFYGENACRVVRNLRGASERYVNWILEYLGPELSEREDNVELHEKLFSSFGARG